MLTTIGAGLETLTPNMVEEALTSSLTAGPAFAVVASANAVMLSGLTGPITSANPEKVTLTVDGPLITMIVGFGASRYMSGTVRVRVVGGFCENATAPSIRIARPNASSFRRQSSVIQLIRRTHYLLPPSD